MSEYMPKVGDRVRATLGENVLVGDVTWLYEDGDVQLDIASPDGSRYVCDMDWQFEQVVEVPTKFGAVIRRVDGVKFVRAQGDEEGTPDWWNPDWGWAFDGVATDGGFTIEFEGVDE